MHRPPRVRRSRPAGRRANAGFTLIETLVAVGIAGVLSSSPTRALEGQLLRARRSDALVALMQAQLAQERFRANHSSYGEPGRRSACAALAGGPLPVEVAPSAADGFELRRHRHRPAGTRRGCRTLRLRSPARSVVYASGSDAATANARRANRTCWSR